MLDKNSKIFVAGHHGLVGSAIWNNLKSRGYENLVGKSHAELDLLDPVAVKQFFDEEQPDAVVLAAAHVGGIIKDFAIKGPSQVAGNQIGVVSIEDLSLNSSVVLKLNRFTKFQISRALPSMGQCPPLW